MLHVTRTCRTPSPQSVAVFLHGFMGTGQDWQGVCGALAARHDCVFVDLPGHGASRLEDGAGPVDVAAMADAVVEVLDGLGLERADLVGYSMGGRVALYLALEFPGRVGRLLLESTSPGIEDASERAARARVDSERAARLRADGLEAFLKTWYAAPLFESLRRHPDFERVRDRRALGRVEDLACVIEDVSPGRQRSLWPRLRELPPDCVMVAGALDPKYVAITQRAAQRSGARAVIVPDAGHNVHVERPEWFAQTALDFLGR